jgi:hypothetical protein
MKKEYTKRVRFGNNMRAEKVYLPRWTKGLMPISKRERGAVNMALNKASAKTLGFACLEYAFDSDAINLLNIAVFLRDKESKRGVTITTTTIKKVLDK